MPALKHPPCRFKVHSKKSDNMHMLVPVSAHTSPSETVILPIDVITKRLRYAFPNAPSRAMRTLMPIPIIMRPYM